MNKDDNKSKKTHSVKVVCIFRPWVASTGASNTRSFVTPGGYEAFNLLMNKLDELNLGGQEGVLIFKYKPFGKKIICNCGHSKFAHLGKYHWGTCQVEGCECRKFEMKNKKTGGK